MKILNTFTNRAFYCMIGTIVLIVASMISNEADLMSVNIFLVLLLIINLFAFFFVWKYEILISSQYKFELIHKFTRKTYILLGITLLVILLNFWSKTPELLVSLLKIFIKGKEIYLDNFMLLILLGLNIGGFWHLWKHEDMIHEEIKASKN